MKKQAYPQLSIYTKGILWSLLGLLIISPGYTSIIENVKYKQSDKFRQLDELLPTPNSFRTASGAPGVDYWQQKVDYEIDVQLDDKNQQLSGSEIITYHNNSPHTLHYLWLQLDANIYRPDSHSNLTEPAPSIHDRVNFDHLRKILAKVDFDGGTRITAVKDTQDEDLEYTIVDTVMRVDLPQKLESGETFSFQIDWHYAMNPSKSVPGRSGAEYFEEDDNYLYEVAQWYPRLVPYTDETGWQNKPFLGQGEFALEFGDFTVRITVPEDHVVASTGVLQNPREVLTQTQRDRLLEAEHSDKPMYIITPEEAKENEESKAEGTNTWIFEAENVRDFAFASSRKFIWDAQGHDLGKNTVMCMSFYPNEGEPLWSQYSTHAIIHTLNVYSKFTFDYPYPVAISVNGPVGGMEYPMICFNGPRPEKDGTYSKNTKYGLISVIIHEVGHNYFPMIINSDERQWTWMDEGFNTFLQYLAEQEWEEDYTSWRGKPERIVNYMTSRNQVPIMTQSDSILQFGNNAYAKPASAFNILRETVMGRELFDFAFKEYARRWMFKRPTPADFFRTMEDASGVDLDWFWRGWFYTTEHVDIAIENLRIYTLETGDPEIDNAMEKHRRDQHPEYIGDQRNKKLPKRVEEHPELQDFYNDYDPLDVTEEDREKFEQFLKDLDNDEIALLKKTNMNFYVIDFKNIGGLVMPLILLIDYSDGSQEELRIPAEIWRRDSEQVSKLMITEKTIEQIILDPYLETADANRQNNYYPPRPIKDQFKLTKPGKSKNPMQKAKEREEKEKKDHTKKDEDER